VVGIHQTDSNIARIDGDYLDNYLFLLHGHLFQLTFQAFNDGRCDEFRSGGGNLGDHTSAGDNDQRDWPRGK